MATREQILAQIARINRLQQQFAQNKLDKPGLSSPAELEEYQKIADAAGKAYTRASASYRRRVSTKPLER